MYMERERERERERAREKERRDIILSYSIANICYYVLANTTL